jgi:hypothetical protein
LFSYRIEATSNKHPLNHAGHQTHHTTTGVHIPHTSHPKAASASTVSTGTPVYQHAANITAGGERRFITARPSAVVTCNTVGDAVICLDIRPMKLRGAQRRPIMKDSEKFNVARADRNRPSRRREKDLIRR